jgi:enolase
LYNEDINIGLDIAASAFCKKNMYQYKNPVQSLNKNQHREYIKDLINIYRIFYAEDPFDEEDFASFRELLHKTKGCLIVGDDLTTTNPDRLKRAIRMKSINAIIVKPNQIGSLIKVKKVIDIAKKHNIKTVISHRSGETTDDTIADLAVGWECDFIKTGIYGRVRKDKLKRLIRIEKEL